MRVSCFPTLQTVSKTKRVQFACSQAPFFHNLQSEPERRFLAITSHAFSHGRSASCILKDAEEPVERENLFASHSRCLASIYEYIGEACTYLTRLARRHI